MPDLTGRKRSTTISHYSAIAGPFVNRLANGKVNADFCKASASPLREIKHGLMAVHRDREGRGAAYWPPHSFEASHKV